MPLPKYLSFAKIDGLTADDVAAGAEYLVQALAEAFSAEVRLALTPDELSEVRRRTLLPEYTMACATHDYCDANMLMLAAFTKTFSRDPDMDNDLDVDLWNDAWDRAKDHFFRLGEEEKPAPRAWTAEELAEMVVAVARTKAGAANWKTLAEAIEQAVLPEKLVAVWVKDSETLADALDAAQYMADRG